MNGKLVMMLTLAVVMLAIGNQCDIPGERGVAARHDGYR